jgi:hypothetical protein
MNSAPHTAPSSPKIGAGDRVEIIGEPGIFLVVRIDRKRHCADVMRMGSNARVEFGIHLAAIRLYADKHPSYRGLPEFAVDSADD